MILQYLQCPQLNANSYLRITRLQKMSRFLHAGFYSIRQNDTCILSILTLKQC